MSWDQSDKPCKPEMIGVCHWCQKPCPPGSPTQAFTGRVFCPNPAPCWEEYCRAEGLA